MCTEYKSKEEVRRQIESLNKKYRAPGCAGSDKSSIQKAGSGDLRSGNEGDRDPERLSSKACAYSETSQKAEGKREEAEETTAEKAEEERRVLDAGE